MAKKATKTPRRSARQQRSQETVRIILEAAAQVLRKQGYAGATTNHIAERAGVSIGTLYQYFADKDELFDALVKEYIAGILATIRWQEIDASGSFEDTLRALIRAGIGAQRHGPELLRALDQIPNTRFRRRLAQAKRDLVAYFTSVLDSYRDEIRPIDRERAAVFLINAAEGIGYNESARTFNDELADELTDLFIRYLQAV